VEHGISGFLVELDDTASLVASLEALMINAGLRDMMGSAGKNKIQDYDLQRVLTEMGEIYLRFLK
jgi:glycosyltransferase involved in cell wall biosynthesis